MLQPNEVINVGWNYQHIETFIKREFKKPPRVNKEWSIYRVSKRLVNIHSTAYEPQVISIGPFHHGRHHLMPMEQFKLQFLHRYLLRFKKRQLKKVVKAALRWEIEARNYYEDFGNNMDSHDFVKMMLVDGCFIIEFLVTVYGGTLNYYSTHDPLIYKAMNINLYHDLILLENQLPFFVLQHLFHFIIQPTNHNFTLLKLLHQFFKHNFMKHYCNIPQNNNNNNTRHLVDFLGFYYSPTDIIIPPNRNIIECNNNSLVLPPSITELYEAGVILEKATTQPYNILKITFKDGVLKIPPFEIHDLFEISMRNLLAFEKFQSGNNTQSYAIHYVLFLGALISKERDSNLLMKKGIISNLIGGSDEEVSNMFNNIGKGVTIQGDFYYENLSKELHKHYKAPRNRWMATLKRDYFNTPWTIISFLTAIIFTLAILLQTVFSGFRFGKMVHM